MARGSKSKKVVLKSGKVVYRTTVDTGTDPVSGKRKQKLLTADSPQELDQMAVKIMADVARGTYFEPEKQSFGEYLSYWLDAYCKPNLGPRTYQEYESIVDKHIKPSFLGNTPLSRLLPVHIQKYYSEELTSGRKDRKKSLGSGLTGSTVLHQHRLIKESLRHAVQWELLNRNPADAVQPPKKERVEIETLTKEEVNTILQATKDTYLFMPTYLAASTTMRLGEVLGLRWADVNLKDTDDAFLSVTQTLKQIKEGLQFGPPKSKSSKRRIDLFPEVVAELKAHQKRQAKEKLETGPIYQNHGLVCCRENGAPITPSNLSSHWSDVARRVLGRDAHFHMLRHTAATMMLERGEPIKRVSEMLGHSSIAITGDIYQHIAPAGRRHAALTLGAALFGSE